MITPNRYPAIEHNRAKPFNEQLRERFQKYQATHALTQTQLATQLGVSNTAVSKYLDGKPEGNVDRLENLIEDLLKAAAKRQARGEGYKPFETAISRSINSYIETLRKTNSVGLISGPAGIGKSIGIELYLEANPTSVLIDCKMWCRSPKELEASLFDSIDHRRWKNGTRYSTLLIERFKGSNRAIVIDNAHRLRRASIAYILDFYDSTNCPICFVGNPEVLDTISQSDQHSSRVGPHKALSHLPSSSQEIVTTVLQKRWPASVNSTRLIPLAIKVLEERGHFRALREEIDFAKELASSPKIQAKATDQCDLYETAFRAAHERLIRNYKL